jgi:hypothetical protein
MIRGLWILSLAMIVTISAAALSADPAQAGEFMLNGTAFVSVPLTAELATGTVGSSKILVPSLGLTIECASGDVFNAAVIPGGTVTGSILLLGCKVAGNSFCKVYASEGQRNAKIDAGDLTAGGKGVLELMNGSHYALVRENGIAFTTAWFTKSTEGCTLNSNEKVTGGTVVKLPDALLNQKTHEVVPLTQAEIEALFSTSLLSYGNQRMWIDGGKATAELSGAHSGGKWSAE